MTKMETKKEKNEKTEQQFFLVAFPANHYLITAMRGEELRKFLRVDEGRAGGFDE